MSRPARVIYHLCRLLLGGLFLYAGAAKALDVTAFARQIASYQVLPYLWNYLVAATLPCVEMLAGALLLAGRRVRPAALLLSFLTIVFMSALASVLVRGMEIDCGCFRPGKGHTSAGVALLRDAGILLLAVATFRLGGKFQRRP